MRSPTRTLHPAKPMLPAALIGLLLVLGACTGDSGASAQASASAATSTAASSAPSAEESAAASEGGEATVTIASFAFDPAEITVSVGDTVRFINEDSATHTVTEGTNGNADADAAFDEQVAGGEWVEVTFDEAGDINVTCLFHSNMHLVVHVE